MSLPLLSRLVSWIRGLESTRFHNVLVSLRGDPVRWRSCKSGSLPFEIVSLLVQDVEVPPFSFPKIVKGEVTVVAFKENILYLLLPLLD